MTKYCRYHRNHSHTIEDCKALQDKIEELVDQGNSVDILCWATYQKLQLLDTAMVPYDEPIYGFSGEQVSTRGYIDLHTVFRDGT